MPRLNSTAFMLNIAPHVNVGVGNYSDPMTDSDIGKPI